MASITPLKAEIAWIRAPLDVLLVALHRKEYDDGTEGNTGTESSRHNVGVLLKPRSVSVSDVVHREKAHIKTWSGIREVVGSIVGDHSRHNQQRIELTEESLRNVLLSKPEGNGDDSTNEESVLKNRVKRVFNSLKNDNIPEDRSIAVNTFTGSGELLLLMSIADTFIVVDLPLCDTHYNQSGNRGGDNLGPESSSRKDLAVVAQLLILDEIDSLKIGVKTESLDHHEGDSLTRQSITSHQFSQHIQSEERVGSRIQQTDGNQEDDTKCQGETQEDAGQKSAN
jgi:hypothetical protein